MLPLNGGSVMIIQAVPFRDMLERIGMRFGLAFWVFRTVGVTLCLVAVGCFIGCGGGSSYSSPPPPPPPTPNPVPTIASVNPNPILVFVPIGGSPNPEIVVTGTNFVQSSIIQWNGSAVLFTANSGSATALTAKLNFSDVATPGTATVTVFNPAPGGGTSNALTVTIVNPPAITGLSPSSAMVGGPAFTLTVTGTDFFPASTVQWNPSGTASGTNPRPTTFVSSTQLQAAISASDIAVAGIAQVEVFGPTTTGGASNAVAFAINNPVPTTAALNPGSAIAGGSGFPLTVTGTNFVPTSTVQWNSSARTTTFISSTSLLATITAADIATGGTAQVLVSTPGPGGGTSGSIPFAIDGPIISLLNPSSAVAGGPTLPLTVTGINFVPTSTVHVNGVALTTNFVSSTQLQATIPAANILTAGTAGITVANPPANGGISPAAAFFIGTTGGANFAVITVNQAVKDIVYDPISRKFYLSVTGTAATNPNTISVLDPATGTVTSSRPAGSDPNVVAISDDSQFLYAGIDGAASVERFFLPSLVIDRIDPLGTDTFGGGPFFALDLQVAPGAPHTTAVTLGVTSSTPSAQGGIAIIDDGVARPAIAKGFGPGGGGGVLYDSLQWGSDSSALFAVNNEGTGFDFYALSVTPSGVVLVKDYPNTFSSFSNRIHFDAGTQLVYANDGHVVDPSTGSSAGNFNTSGPMVPDSTLNKAFFLTGGGSPTVTITSFDLKLFTPINSITVNSVTGNPQRLIRWGQNGLAFNTDGGQVFLIGGNFVH
jgi:hypothetical protein